MVCSIEKAASRPPFFLGVARDRSRARATVWLSTAPATKRAEHGQRQRCECERAWLRHIVATNRRIAAEGGLGQRSSVLEHDARDCRRRVEAGEPAEAEHERDRALRKRASAHATIAGG